MPVPVPAVKVVVSCPCAFVVPLMGAMLPPTVLPSRTNCRNVLGSGLLVLSKAVAVMVLVAPGVIVALAVVALILLSAAGGCVNSKSNSAKPLLSVANPASVDDT